MEWFGLTQFGVSDPIKDMMRPDYKEPEVPPDLLELAEKEPKKPLAELVNEIDCYIGSADGYAYKSYDRLIRMRNKGIYKQVGPLDMYCYPGTDAMKFGWWLTDPALRGKKWPKATANFPRPKTDVGRYIAEALLVDRFFRL